MSPKVIHRLTDFLAEKTHPIVTALDPANAIVLESETPDLFQKRAAVFAKQATRLFKKSRGDLFEIARRIQDVKRRNWMNDPDIVQLWFQVTTQYLQHFSEHPSKKVAALVVDADNSLLCWGVNRIPSGIKRQPERYAEGIRKNYIVCAERIALAHYQKLEISLFDGQSPTDEAVRETVVNYSDSTQFWGTRRPLPPGSVMFVSNLPCTACCHAILAHRPTGFVTDFDAGAHFKRAGSRRENYKTMLAAGIKMIDINTLTT